MKISELSKKTGISQRMLRYFEQEELLVPGRSSTDYRDYEVTDEARVLEIREWQRLGLTLKEIKKLLLDPANSDQVLEPVLARERDAFNEKERAFRDLRKRLLGRKSPHFHFRVAHPIPGLNGVLSRMEELGWRPQGFTYHLFCGWRDDVEVGTVMFGDILLRSAFYLLISEETKMATPLEGLMTDFYQAALSEWPDFEGRAPKEIESADLGEFFGPQDIVLCLKFARDETKNLTLVLPYQAVFALAKGPQLLKA